MSSTPQPAVGPGPAAERAAASGLYVSAGLYADAIVARADRTLDRATAPLLRAPLERVWDLPDATVVIIDVGGLAFCDSAGLSELVCAGQHSRAIGTGLMLVGVGPHLARRLEPTGLRRRFEVHPDLTAALRAARVRQPVDRWVWPDDDRFTPAS